MLIDLRLHNLKSYKTTLNVFVICLIVGGWGPLLSKFCIASCTAEYYLMTTMMSQFGKCAFEKCIVYNVDRFKVA